MTAEAESERALGGGVCAHLVRGRRRRWLAESLLSRVLLRLVDRFMGGTEDDDVSFVLSHYFLQP